MTKKIFCLMVLTTLLVGCSNDDNGSNIPKKRKNIELSRSEQVMTKETTDFAFRFFQQVNKSETKEANWMVSPLSASMTLGMITNGAGENTLEELKSTLGFSQANIDEMNAYYHRLLTELPDLDNTTRLELANSIWINEGFEVKSPFVDVNKQMYDAKVNNLNFSSTKAVSTINNWASEKTHGLIPKVIEITDPNAKMYLLNALYFKGMWQEDCKFDKNKTKKENFTNADGSTTKVQMMNQTNEFLFGYNDYFWMASFPYGNGAYSMTILLPDEELGLDKCLESMTLENWEQWKLGWNTRTLIVKMPRFEIKYKKDLIEDMQELGVKDAFNAHADFSNMSEHPLFLGLLQQFTRLKVDEEGTEAAAVTIGGMIDAAAPPSGGPVEFYINRPFAFMIKEASTGTILFMGKVTEL